MKWMPVRTHLGSACKTSSLCSLFDRRGSAARGDQRFGRGRLAALLDVLEPHPEDGEVRAVQPAQVAAGAVFGAAQHGVVVPLAVELPRELQAVRGTEVDAVRATLANLKGQKDRSLTLFHRCRFAHDGPPSAKRIDPTSRAAAAQGRGAKLRRVCRRNGDEKRESRVPLATTADGLGIPYTCLLYTSPSPRDR